MTGACDPDLGQLIRRVYVRAVGQERALCSAHRAKGGVVVELPKDFILLTTQKNDVLQAIRVAGLNPKDFHWEQHNSSGTKNAIVSVLTHTPTGYYYRFDMREGGTFAEFSPGRDSRIEHQYPGNWVLQFSYARGWIANLKREIEAPDLWASATEEAGFVELSAQATRIDSVFNSQVQADLSARLAELERFIVEARDLTDAQHRFVKDQLSYLVAEAHHQKAREWINIGIGVLVQIILTIALPPEQAKSLFQLFGSIVRQVFTLMLGTQSAP